MKLRSLILIGLLVLIVGAPASVHAQNFIPVTASNIGAIGGNGALVPVQFGSFCVQGTDPQGNIINFNVGGGGQVINGASLGCVAVQNGVLQGPFSLPNPQHTNPQGVLYTFTVVSNNKTVLQYKLVGISGTTFNLDLYSPGSPPPTAWGGGTVNGNQTVNGDFTDTGNTTLNNAVCAGTCTGFSGGSVLDETFTNDAGTGTVSNKLAKLVTAGSTSTVVLPLTADTGGVVGVVSSGGGTSGSAVIQILGSIGCVFDAATMAGDYVQISSSTRGDCHDAGSTYPTAGQVLGRVLSTNGSAGTYSVDIFSAEIQAAGGGTVGTTGTPANGELAQFSGIGPDTITNANLGGDCTTSNTTLVTCGFSISKITGGATGAGTYDFSGSTHFKIHTSGSFVTAANGEIGYDTTLGNYHGWNNGSDRIFPMVAPGTAVNNDCVTWAVSAGNVQFGDAGAPCGSGGGSGTVNAAAQYSLGYYSAAGSSTTVSGAAPPSLSTGASCVWTSSGSSPACAFQGVPVTTAITSTYTFNGTGASGTGSSADQGFFLLANPSAARVYTLGQPGTTGFANNPFWGIYNENSSNAITFTPTSSNCNGSSTCLGPPFSFTLMNSNNSNYFAAIMPTYGAFPNCPTGAEGYTASTGLFVCNSISGGTPSFPLTVGGTLNNGGIPCFTSASTEASSASLPAGDFVLGGGPGVCPSASFSIVPAANGGLNANASGFTGILRDASGTGSASELSGDATTSGSNAVTLATVNSNVGSYTNANITVNAKGLVTAAANGSGGGGTTPTVTYSLSGQTNSITSTAFVSSSAGYATGIWAFSAEINVTAFSGSNSINILLTTPGNGGPCPSPALTVNTTGTQFFGIQSTGGPQCNPVYEAASTTLNYTTTVTLNGSTFTYTLTIFAQFIPSGVSGPAFTTLTDGSTVTWAAAGVPAANASLAFTVHSGNRTLAMTGLVNGGSYVLTLKQDSTGGEGLTLGSGCTWKVIGGGSGAVTLSTGASAIDVLAFTYDGANCYANLGKNYN